MNPETEAKILLNCLKTDVETCLQTTKHITTILPFEAIGGFEIAFCEAELKQAHIWVTKAITVLERKSKEIDMSTDAEAYKHALYPPGTNHQEPEEEPLLGVSPIDNPAKRYRKPRRPKKKEEGQLGEQKTQDHP